MEDVHTRTVSGERFLVPNKQITLYRIGETLLESKGSFFCNKQTNKQANKHFINTARKNRGEFL